MCRWMGLAALWASVAAMGGTPGEVLPPSNAEVLTSEAYVREAPSASARRIGLAERGAVLRVRSCVVPSATGTPQPASCSAPRAWALLEPLGAIQARLLAPTTADSAVPRELLFAMVRRGGTHAHASPSEKSVVLAELPAERVLALDAAEGLLEGGWYRRIWGGYVRANRLRLYEPAPFVGEPSPAAPLAFLFRDSAAQPLDPLRPPEPLPKFTRLPVLAVSPDVVDTPSGAVPRKDVRIALRRPRPPEVPEGAKWIHIDLREQVLTAYEGDQLVYATLVSTGKAEPKRRTHPGVFQVWMKAIRSRMHGEDYFMEDVPYAQYFNRGQAVHGTFWHAAFGQRASHGCVNLSLADARWLFDWAPPELPSGWKSRSATPADEKLWVVIEQASPPQPPAQAELGPAGGALPDPSF